MKTNRVVDIVVGLGAGSEGKLNIIEPIAHKYDGAMCRGGGPNAAHTTYYQGKKEVWHQIPACALHAPRSSHLVLGAGAQIDLKHLFREIQVLKDNDAFFLAGTDKPRLRIDHHATIVDEHDIFAENGFSSVCGPQWFNPTSCETHNGDGVKEECKKCVENGFPSEFNPSGPFGSCGVLGCVFGRISVVKTKGTCEGCPLYPKGSMHRKIGSTTHGTGMNAIRKMARGSTLIRDHKGDPLPPVTYAKDHPLLQDFIEDTVALLARLIDEGRGILLEGTQGTTLSLHHGAIPYTTSRDTNAGAWLAESGVSPLAVRDVFGVTRSYPIRVAGNSGPMGKARELTWKEVTERAGMQYEHHDDPKQVKGLIEYTSSTKRVRRIFEFCDESFAKAIAINRPTQLMLTFVDYLNHRDAGCNSWATLSQQSKDWILALEARHNCFFRWLKTGPESHQIIDRSEAPEVQQPRPDGIY